MTRPHSDDDSVLDDTADVPPPRRSDEAFARAVAADIDARNAARIRWPWLALGPLAATAAAFHIEGEPEGGAATDVEGLDL